MNKGKEVNQVMLRSANMKRITALAVSTSIAMLGALPSVEAAPYLNSSTVYSVSGPTQSVNTVPAMTGLSASPDNLFVPVGQSVSTVVYAVYDDGTQTDVTPYTVWNIPSPAIVSVDQGLVTGALTGSTVIEAVYNGQSVNIQVNVTSPGITRLSASPENLSVPVGQAVSTVVYAVYDDGTQTDVTPYTVWNIPTPAIVSVDHGLITGASTGSTVIEAVYGGQSVNIQVDVTSDSDDSSSGSSSGEDVDDNDSNVDDDNNNSGNVNDGSNNSGSNDSNQTNNENPNNETLNPPVTPTLFDNAVDVERVIAKIKEAIAQNISLSFKDTDAHWDSRDIRIAAKLGIIDGYGDNSFQPDKSVTRAELSKMIATTFALTLGNTQFDFTDTNKHWAENDIRLLASNGLIHGYSDGSFHPEEHLSRYEAVALLLQIIQLDAVQTSNTVTFTDISSSSPEKSELEAAAKSGLIQGIDEHHFAPDKDTTRAELITLLIRMLRMDSDINHLIDSIEL